MALQETMTAQGNWLFRWRSFVPLPVYFFALFLAMGMPTPDQVGGFWRHWWLVCLAISLLGLLMRILVAGFVPEGTSGRNTKAQVAQQLNTTGFYSLVRNPLYTGNFILSLGPVLYPRDWLFAGLYVAIFYFYYERIIFAEEAFLRDKFKKKYLDWAARTPMLIPRLSGWEGPALTFSLRKTIRREMPTFGAMMLSFFLLVWFQGWRITGTINQDQAWLYALIVVMVLYALETILHRTTRLLDN